MYRIILISLVLSSCQYAAKEKRLSSAQIDSINKAQYPEIPKAMDTIKLGDPKYVGEEEISFAIKILKDYNQKQYLSPNDLNYLIERHDQYMTYSLPFNAPHELRLLELELEHELRKMRFWLPEEMRRHAFENVANALNDKGVTVTKSGKSIELYGDRYEDSTLIWKDYKNHSAMLKRAKFETVLFASKTTRKVFKQ